MAVNLKTMIEMTKDELHRSQMTVDDFISIKEALKLATNHEETPTNEDVLNYIRILRNSCANCPRNQDIINDLEIDKLVISYACEKWLDEDSVQTFLLISTQFLGNYITENQKTQLKIWSRVYPIFIKTVINSENPKIISAISMVLFNCLKNESSLKQLLNESEGHDIIKSLLKSLSMMADTDWMCLCLTEYFLFNKQFMLLVFEECSCDVQENLLLHLEEWLREHDCKWQHCVAESLSEIFSTISNRILGNCNVDNGQATFLIMKILCLLTAKKDCREYLQNSDVLKSCVHLILNLNKIDLKSDMTQQLNQTLIQLIGNLCYKNKTNQDFVRNNGIIPVIMNNCNINERTPYVQQWAILALRNLCDNNPDNQNEIAKLEKVGIAENRVLSDMGINVDETADGKFQLKFNK